MCASAEGLTAPGGVLQEGAVSQGCMKFNRVCQRGRQNLFFRLSPLETGGERGKLLSDFVIPFYFDFWAKSGGTG